MTWESRDELKRRLAKTEAMLNATRVELVAANTCVRDLRLYGQGLFEENQTLRQAYHYLHENYQHLDDAIRVLQADRARLDGART